MNLTKLTFLVTACLLFSISGEAKKSMFLRGGQGFLYPDHNSFVNPGQLARNMGFGMQLAYGVQEVLGTSIQAGTLSASHSGKTMSFGVAATRLGAQFDANGSDSVDAGVGFNLGKRATLGIRYERQIDEGQVNDGNATVGFNFNPSKSSGVSLGAAYHTTLNAITNVAGATVGIGYSNKDPNDNFELNVYLPDLNSTSAYIASLHGTIASKVVYFGASYIYDNSVGTTAQSSAKARFGYVFGKKMPWDLSAFTTYSLETGVEPLFGATLRAAL